MKSYNNPVYYIEFSINRTQQKQLQKHCYNRYVTSVESNILINYKQIWNNHNPIGNVEIQLSDKKISY